MKNKMQQLPLFSDFTQDQTAKYMKTLRGPYSQSEFAGLLETDSSVVDNWERGISKPRSSHMRAALEHYKSWAILAELPAVARAAMDAAGIKKSLTRAPEPAISTANITTSPVETPKERSETSASSSRTTD